MKEKINAKQPNTTDDVQEYQLRAATTTKTTAQAICPTLTMLLSISFPNERFDLIENNYIKRSIPPPRTLNS
jgi:hypothetical protein